MATWSYDSWRAARRPWVLEIDGRSWVARPVSAEAVLAYQGQLIGASTPAAWQATLDLLRLAFPLRLAYWWRRDPVKEFARVIRESPDAAREALASFFPLLRGATTEQAAALLSTEARPAHGTTSPR